HDDAGGARGPHSCPCGRSCASGPDVFGGARPGQAGSGSDHRRPGDDAGGALIVLGKTRRIHFVGVGGNGGSRIAELLKNLGYLVSGSDEKRSSITERLASLGVKVTYGHDAAHVAGADVVVVSSAVRTTNVEVREAARQQIPVIPRGEMLAELMR